jgi:hypothetical protein
VWSSAAISNIAKRVSEKHCMFFFFLHGKEGAKKAKKNRCQKITAEMFEPNLIFSN